LEIFSLRHQIGVLQRSVKRPKLNAADRFLWAWLGSLWNGWESRVSIFKPATVIGWQRKGFGLFWSWRIRRGKPGRQAVPKEVRKLIRMLSCENPLWGRSAVVHQNSIRASSRRGLLCRGKQSRLCTEAPRQLFPFTDRIWIQDAAVGTHSATGPENGRAL
jgi:hypothetical protein